MTDRCVLVPHADVDPGEIPPALEELGATPREPDEGALASWTLDDATITYYEDAGLLIELFLVEGPDREDVARRLRERLRMYTPDDMPGLFASMAHPDDMVEISHYLAILAAVAPPEADSTLLELFRQGFGHPDEIVRRRAALFSTVPRWPELRVMVERLADEDPEDAVREAAAVALRSFER